MSVSSQGDEVIDISQLIHVVWRDKLSIAAFVFVALLVTYVVTSRMQPVYQGTATLLIESKEANVVSIEEVYGVDSTQSEYFATQFQIMASRKLAEEVVDELNLVNHPEYDPLRRKTGFGLGNLLPNSRDVVPPTEQEIRNSVVSRFRDETSIEPIRNTHLVKIKYESVDSELAMLAANALGERYIESHLESRLALTRKAADWLSIRLEGMQDDLEKSERALQSFRETENLVDVSGVTTLSEREIEQLSERAVEARKRVAEAKSLLDSVGSVSVYQEEWETLQSVLGDPLVQRLRERETESVQELTEISQRYGPKHPRRIAAESKLSDSRIALRSQVQKVVIGFQSVYDKAVANLEEAESARDRTRMEIQNISRKRYELSQLEREVQTNRQLYDMFFTRIKETNSGGFEAANARFVDFAQQPKIPIKPRTGLILLVALFISSVFGVALALLRDFLDNTIKSPTDVELHLEQPVLGAVPTIDSEHNARVVSEAVLDTDNPLFAESVRSIRTGVALAGIDRPIRSVVVTSSVPGEGKTTTAMNLAFAFGQLGSTILVDADMRRPSVAENLGLPHRSPGLSNLIAETEPFDKCTYSYHGIDVLPAGVVPPNPLELISSKRFDSLLKVLMDKYDRVIIDSAPTHAVSDSQILSTHVDGVLYVVKSDATPIHFSQEGLQKLLRVNANILGVVLNQFELRKSRYRGYAGYSNYHSSEISKT